MKLFIYSCLIFVTIAAKAQVNSFSLSKNGRLIASITPFQYVDYFDKYSYNAYKQPVELPLIKEVNFNKTQLLTPQSLVQSYIAATSNEWLDLLSEEKNASAIPPEFVQYRKSETFKKEYTLKVISEFYCTYKNREYCILLCYYNYSKGTYVTLPSVAVKTKDGWKISSNKSLSEFAGYFYIKPKEFKKLIGGQQLDVQRQDADLVPKYVFDGIFRTDQGFFFSYVFGDSAFAKKHRSLLLPKKELYTSPVDITVKSTDPFANKIAITSNWSTDGGSLYQYKEEEELYLNSNISENDSNYKSSPELALAAWVYDGKESKKKHALGYSDYVDKEVNKNLVRIKSGQGSIRPLYKIVFYDNNKNAYALVYYDENIVDNNVSYHYGESRLLLKAVNNQWVVDFSPGKEITDLIGAFDKLSLEALKMLFLQDKKTGEGTTDWYFSGNYLGRPSDGTIYINSIDKYRFENVSSVPEKIRRKPSVLTW